MWAWLGQPALNRGALAATLLRQHNVKTRDQALAAGLTSRALRHRHRHRPDGPWQDILPGVFLALHGTATTDQRDMAAVLYTGPESVITGHAALRLHGLTSNRPDVVDILAPAAMQRRSCGFIRLQRTSRLPDRPCRDGDIRF